MGQSMEREGSSTGARIIFGVAGVVGVYWFFESVMQFWLTTQPTLSGLLLGADIYETLRRVVVLVFFAVLASHMHYNVERSERMERALRDAREEEAKLQVLALSLSTELNLNRLLTKILDISTQILSAERGTLFMYDAQAGRLKSVVAQGLDGGVDLDLPPTQGVAGAAFTSGQPVNVPDAYRDDRFWPELDRLTGYRTRSILSVPVRNKQGQVVGVLEILNKSNGSFTPADVKKLEVFSAHVSVAIENASLFDDVLNLKNYTESMLNSMSNGVVSVDRERRVVKCNTAALKILGLGHAEPAGRMAGEIFDPWVVRGIDRAIRTGREYLVYDAELRARPGATASINLATVPLKNAKAEVMGALMILEDLTGEKRLKGALARYMTKEVAEKLLEGGEAVLGGVTQEATVLFSDISGFTSISERLSPQATVSLLNQYFTIMVDIVFRHKGVLDKYIGDGLMAVFGAPVATEMDPDNAVRTAVEMMQILAAFNRDGKGAGLPPLFIRVGINTDEILSGNIGSIKRMDYTVIGDGVNLAFRLEQANKYYQTGILVSEFTYRKLKDKYIARPMDLIRVKGKTKPVQVYEILDHHTEDDFPGLYQVVDLFRAGLGHYTRRDWTQAAQSFEKALALNPADHPSALYLARCRHFEERPPDPDWDGVWIMDEKVKEIRSIWGERKTG
jgi:adenylate cyclase